MLLLLVLVLIVLLLLLCLLGLLKTVTVLLLRLRIERSLTSRIHVLTSLAFGTLRYWVSELWPSLFMLLFDRSGLRNNRSVFAVDASYEACACVMNYSRVAVSIALLQSRR